MSAFPDWRKFAVAQKRPQTGCIPTAYEILLRAAGTPGIDFSSFQDEFDLDQHAGRPRNNFDTVASEIQKRYPNVVFKNELFSKGDGHKKVARLEEFIAARRPVVVSISNEPNGHPGWHIMVVVDATADELTLLEYVDQHGFPHTKSMSKSEIALIHDNYRGGDEIAYLE